MEQITKENLIRLYCEQNYSDESIGKIFNVSGVTINNYRKKWGIERKKVIDKLKEECTADELTVTLAAEKYGVDIEFLRKQVRQLKVARILHNVPIYRCCDVETLLKGKIVPSGSLNCKQIAGMLGIKPRNARDRLHSRHIEPVARCGKEEYYSPDVVDKIK
jgi:hypothetical protein